MNSPSTASSVPSRLKTAIALVGLLATSLSAFAQPTRPAPINRLYVFGDSYSDVGEGYLDGNGPTAVAYLAQRLGLKLLPSNAPTRQTPA